MRNLTIQIDKDPIVRVAALRPNPEIWEQVAREAQGSVQGNILFFHLIVDGAMYEEFD